MALGSVNTPGAFGLERIEAEKTLAARITSAERAISSSASAQGKPGGGATLDATGKLVPEQKPAYTAAEVGAAAAGHTHTATQVGAAAANHTHTAGEVGAKESGWVPFSAGTSAPADKTKLWIDTTANTGGLKYWNGSAWVAVPVAYT